MYRYLPVFTGIEKHLSIFNCFYRYLPLFVAIYRYLAVFTVITGITAINYRYYTIGPLLPALLLLLLFSAIFR